MNTDQRKYQHLYGITLCSPWWSGSKSPEKKDTNVKDEPSPEWSSQPKKYSQDIKYQEDDKAIDEPMSQSSNSDEIDAQIAEIESNWADCPHVVGERAMMDLDNMLTDL